VNRWFADVAFHLPIDIKEFHGTSFGIALTLEMVEVTAFGQYYQYCSRDLELFQNLKLAVAPGMHSMWFVG